MRAQRWQGDGHRCEGVLRSGQEGFVGGVAEKRMLISSTHVPIPTSDNPCICCRDESWLHIAVTEVSSISLPVLSRVGLRMPRHVSGSGPLCCVAVSPLSFRVLLACMAH
jgi:hypothetical protein